MPSGLVENVAYGAQDIYITGNPQITFFKNVYRRHTNFSKESIMQSFINQPSFGGKSSIIIDKTGDLIQEMYLEIVLPTIASNSYVYGVGNSLIKSASIEIGGTIIDKHYTDWFNIWNELSIAQEKLEGYDTMVGNKYQYYGYEPSRFYVPLLFWFNRNPGLALPLISLAYSDVKLIIEFNTAESISNNLLSSSELFDCKLYIDYIYLDSDERRYLAQNPQEYLIEQVQKIDDIEITTDTTWINAKLNFKLPVKEIFWILQTSNVSSLNTFGPFDYSLNGNGINHPISTAQLKLNNSDRFLTRINDYFYLVQNYQRHTRIPRTDIVHKTYVDDDFTDTPGYFRNFIYTYSFAIQPEQHQPSGTCNFSRLNNQILSLTFPTFTEASKLKIFAVNYNVLRVMSGQAGVAYST